MSSLPLRPRKTAMSGQIRPGPLHAPGNQTPPNFVSPHRHGLRKQQAVLLPDQDPSIWNRLRTPTHPGFQHLKGQPGRNLFSLRFNNAGKRLGGIIRSWRPFRGRLAFAVELLDLLPSNNPDRDALWSIKILCLLKPCECLTDTCNSPSSTGSISHARTVVLERQPIGSGCSGNVSSRSTSKSSKKSIIPPSPSTFIIFRSLSPVITGIPSTVCNSISQMPTGASDTTFRINFFFPLLSGMLPTIVTHHHHVRLYILCPAILPHSRIFQHQRHGSPFASFTLTGSVTASRQEMTTGSSPFASTHCAPADGSHSGTSIRPKILSSRFKNMLFTSGAFRPTESFRVTRTGSSWQQ